MADFFGSAWPYAVMLVGAAVTYLWRGLGVALAGRIGPSSRLLDWIGCVAYALLAGLIARMIVLPIGPLAEVGLGARLTSVAVAAAIYLALRRNLLLGVVSGSVTLVLLNWWALQG